MVLKKSALCDVTMSNFSSLRYQRVSTVCMTPTPQKIQRQCSVYMDWFMTLGKAFQAVAKSTWLSTKRPSDSTAHSHNENDTLTQTELSGLGQWPKRRFSCNLRKRFAIHESHHINSQDRVAHYYNHLSVRLAQSMMFEEQKESNWEEVVRNNQIKVRWKQG